MVSAGRTDQPVSPPRGWPTRRQNGPRRNSSERPYDEATALQVYSPTRRVPHDATTAQRDMIAWDTAPLSYQTIAEAMLRRVPALGDAYEFSICGEQLLVTVFLGSAAEYMMEQASRLSELAADERAETEARIAAILEVVEDGFMSPYEDLHGALSAGFLEELETDDSAAFQKVLSMLGPKSRARATGLMRFYRSKKWADFLKSL